MKMSNFRIGTRLAAGFGLVLVLLALVVAVGLQRFHDVGRATATLIDDDWAKAEAAATIDTMTRANARRTLELFIAPDDGYRTRVREKIASNALYPGHQLLPPGAAARRNLKASDFTIATSALRCSGVAFSST